VRIALQRELLRHRLGVKPGRRPPQQQPHRAERRDPDRQAAAPARATRGPDRLPDGRALPGVANFGENPATGQVEARLEVHLFDFDEELYGQTIETELIAFLRPELNFDSLEALIAQIAQDARQARALLGAQ
jgi:hypothetical protein